MNKIVYIFLFLLTLVSCASRDKIVYMNNVGNSSEEVSKNYDLIIQNDDILSIIINSENPELVEHLNSKLVNLQANAEAGGSMQRLQTYIVDNEGNIEFPSLGKIKLAGLTRIQATNLIQDKLKSQVKDATVNLRLLNFKISVQGEVSRPGTHTIDSDRITLLQALSLSGDLTIYGKRNNILVIREVNGQRYFQRVDITKPDFINSDFYYLSQNDIVYVEPNKTRVNSSSVGPNVTLALSAASLLLSVFVVIFR